MVSGSRRFGIVAPTELTAEALCIWLGGGGIFENPEKNSRKETISYAGSISELIRPILKILDVLKPQRLSPELLYVRSLLQ